MRPFLYLETLRYLKPVQIWNQVRYRTRTVIRKLTGFSYKFEVECNASHLNFQRWIAKPESVKKGRFQFLNQEKQMLHGINWNDTGHGLLWAYHLNYMDFILQETMTKKDGLAFINEFIHSTGSNPIGIAPYPTSLRGINWIKFLSHHHIAEARINHSLFAQYLILNDTIEYHLYGNHLLENGFSLLFAALYFRHEVFYRKAKKILLKELEEQVLKDGGHFEQSPMYQLIMLDRMLDCLNLLIHNKVFPDQDELIDILKVKISFMLGWVNELSYSDGTLPMFNDSTEGMAPRVAQISEYADRLQVAVRTVKLRESGFRCYNTALYQIRITMGSIMAPYIPGHSHADTFSFDLMVHDKPLIVDTGISTYEKNQRRQYERGTSAHNTVQFRDIDSSLVWGGFRMGRRAFVSRYKETGISYEATHSGYSRFGVRHERGFHFKGDSVRIADSFIGKKGFEGIARFHFHPDVDPVVKGGKVRFSGGQMQFDKADHVSSSPSSYAAGYNQLIKSNVIEVLFHNRLNTVLTFDKLIREK